MAVREPDLVHARERRGAVRVPSPSAGRRSASCPGGPRTSSRRSPGSSARARCTSRAMRRRTAGGATGRSRTAWRRTASCSARSAACYVHEPDEVRKADGGAVHGLLAVPPRMAGARPAARAARPGPDPRPARRAGRRGPTPSPRSRRPPPTPRCSPRRARRPPVTGWRAGSTARSPRTRRPATASIATAPRGCRRTCAGACCRRTRSPNAPTGPGEGRRVFLQELVWREFYAHVLWHHPRVLREPFQPAFAALAWADDDDGFRAWAEGRTGYPIVDAAMRQLRASGLRAQPGAHDRGLVPDQGPAARLAARRGRVHAPPHRRRRRLEQRRLAVDRLDRHGPAAVLPDLQPGPAGEALRPRRRLRPPLGPGAGRRARERASTSRGR